MNETKPILTVTGSDSTSGSGVQADIKTISALGGYAVSAITSITVQTSLGIQEFYDLPASIVEGQIEAAMNDAEPDVVKIGMIRSVDVLDVIVRALEKYKPKHVIFDPVFQSSSGDALIPVDVAREITDRLLPLCTLVVQLDPMPMHGLANRYSSAVAVFLNRGESEEKALQLAKEYVNAQVVKAEGWQGRSSKLYNDFIDALEQHVRTNSDVHYYANRLNVSSRYLAQVTKRISGKAPKTIIDDRLIQEIELQLHTTDKTVQEIAYSCGFSSQAHFTKFFKKMKNMSPTKFRKL